MPLTEWVTVYEAPIRLGSFVVVFLLMASWEYRRPLRRPLLPRLLRWSNNLGLVVLNSVVARLLFPAAVAGVARWAEIQGWGLGNHYSLPLAVAIPASLVVLDLVIYLQHVMFHAIPLLWRFHRVHHADSDYDVTTGLRFHPLEIVLSLLIKFAAVLLLGPPLVAVVIFEVLLNALAMFNHGNVGLPARLDRALRWIVVTPAMHRIHHSVEVNETNSNFGFNLPWWDRLLGTYRDQPGAGQLGMRIGLGDDRPAQSLVAMLLLPFRRDPGGYAIDSRDQRRGEQNEGD